MIEISSLTKSYGSREVLRSLNLKIQPGQITAIAGPNACGKTTLIKCILGLVVPESGAIRINGKATDSSGDFRRHIGYMPQTPRFPDNLCARELYGLLESLRGEVAARKEELISYFHIQDILDQPLDQLSGGTRQKISAVAAFMFNAPIVILDEPTAGLDPLAAVSFKDLLSREANSGKTILLVSHFLSEIEQIAGHLAFLNEGEVIYADTVLALMNRTGAPTLERALTRFFKEYEKADTRNGSVLRTL